MQSLQALQPRIPGSTCQTLLGSLEPGPRCPRVNKNHLIILIVIIIIIEILITIIIIIIEL